MNMRLFEWAIPGSLLRKAANGLASLNRNGVPHRTGLLVLCVLAVAAIYSISRPLMERSVWIDEAMLLTNLIDNSAFSLLNPLTLYDQAAPPGAILLLKLSMEAFAGNIPAIRYSTLAMVLASLIYAAYGVGKAFGLLASALVLILAISSYRFLYYATELKHYAFELAGVCILFGWFFLYLNREPRFLQWTDGLVLTAALSLGFSTLFPFAGILLALAVLTLGMPRIKHRRAVDLTLIAALVLVGIAYKYLISYYSELQINNYYDVFNRTAGPANLKMLYLVVDGAYKFLLPFSLLFAGALHIIDRRLKVQNSGAERHAPILFSAILTISFVCIASAAGLYPTHAARQMVWLIPVIIFLMATTAAASLATYKTRMPWILLSVVLAVALLSLHSTLKLRRFEESTANQALYDRLGQLEAGPVLVYSGAQPSLELYKYLNPALNKHTYLGLINNKSGRLIDNARFLKHFSEYADSQPGVWGSMVHFRNANNYDVYSAWAVRQTRKLDEFYILISHITKVRRESFFKQLNTRTCNLSSIFEGRHVELLKAHCND